MTTALTIPCTTTHSNHAKTIRQGVNTLTLARIAVLTHDACGRLPEAWLTTLNGPVQMPLDEARRIYDKLPGTSVRYDYSHDECDEVTEEVLADVPDDEERARLDAAFGGRR